MFCRDTQWLNVTTCTIENPRLGFWRMKKTKDKHKETETKKKIFFTKQDIDADNKYAKTNKQKKKKMVITPSNRPDSALSTSAQSE